MTDRLVTIATFGERLEAELAKAKLQAEGIKCLLSEDPTHRLYGYATGGVKLQVNQADAAKASEILQPEPDNSST